MGEQNPRLTTGSSALYNRDEKRSFFLPADQWNDAFLSLQTLFMQGMSGNRGSMASFVPPSVYIGFPLFVLPKSCSGQFDDAPGGERVGCLLGEPSRRRPVLLRPAPPLRRAPLRPDPPAVCPGFGFDKCLTCAFALARVSGGMFLQ